jgi:1,2-phenylacetyl-CoA epoxidase catalytic subunit
MMPFNDLSSEGSSTAEGFPILSDASGGSLEATIQEAALYAPPEDIDDNVPLQVRYGKLYDIQHWRSSTDRYLRDTTYGFLPDQAPLTKEEFRKLPSSTYHAVVGAIAGGLAGEYIAFECSAALCASAPDEQSRMFLATQVIDEARHVEVFSHRLKMLGKEDLQETMHAYVNPRLFRFHEHMRERVCERKDFAGGIIGQNLALEGLALGFFEFHAELLAEVDPGTSRILETVLLDERRHVGFGLVRLAQIMEESPSKKQFIQDTMGELSDEMLSILLENADNMASQGLDPKAAMQRVNRYHSLHLNRLGIESLEGIV